MIHPLLRHVRLLPGLLLFLWALGAARPAQASHLLGGEMTYRYLDANGPNTAPLRYEITLQVYNNSNPGAAAPVASATIGIYQSAGAQVNLTATNYAGTIQNGRAVVSTYTSTTYASVPVPVGCNITGATQQPYVLRVFTIIVNLPTTTAGYYAFWTASARNNTIGNLSNPGGSSLTLYTTLAPPVYTNHSPVFANQAIAVICANDTTVLLNNAVDADGDQLVYSFGTPYNQANYNATFTPPPPTVTYLNSSYSATAPLGAAPNNARIGATTGIAKYYATTAGAQYVVAVDVKEYRQVGATSVLIGTTRRDVQLIVGTCPPTPAPVLPTSGSGGGGSGVQHNYTIEAGSSLSIPFTTTQADGHDLDLTATSELLDGTGGHSATFGGNPGTVPAGSPAGTVTLSGTGGTVSGTFVFNSACGEARTAPYDIAITVMDKGCGGKTVADVIHINVIKPDGPSSVTGDAAVCGLNTTHTYTANNVSTPAISWRLSGGGSFASANPGNPVQVLWTTAGTYTLTARGLTQYGCFTDSIVKTVVVSPAAVITVAGNQTICQGSNTTLTVQGAAPYTISGGGTTQTGPGPFTLAPTQTTTYTITGTPTGVGCVPTTQVTITVNPVPAAATGPAVSTCSGVPVTIGAAPVAGNTYQWTPATGLSSATVANPTVTLTNTSGAPTTTTYTLTETTANNCVTTNSVAVTVNPNPVAVPGAAVSYCSGGSAQLGGAPVAGLTYSWSPATGLSSATVANPTVTLTNTTGAPVTQTYTLTVTNAATSCTSTGTVAVTVNPNPVAVPGAAVSYCSGGSAQLGGAPVAGLTYSWSPATGLSSATVANPTVTLTNTTGAPVTQTYTLTVTNAATSCTSTGTVAVTVNPNPVAVPGAALSLCSGSTGQLGAAPVAGLTYQWSPATGLSSATVANPTVMLTNTTGANTTTTYTLTVTNATTSCTSTGTVVVTVKPAPAVVPGANVVICSGETGQLGAAPVAGLTYQWSPATGLSSATAANPTVTLTNATGVPVTTTYTLTVTNAATACTNMGTVDVLVNPTPVPVPGSNLTLCSGVAGQLGGAPLPGYTYVWTPATGLSNPNIANPTVTLTNTTGVAYSVTYTLRLTSAPITCTNQGTVTVTVNPAPAVAPGAAVAICSGNTAQLGAAPVAGYAYNWSPATGLSSATSANPTVTLTNTSGTATTQTYTLTVTNSATSCTNTGTVAVTVNPNPVAVPGAAVAFCSGGSAQLGGTPVAGLIYSWSPATGLSSATVANPTVTLTNTTSAAITTTYTLTVTNPATSCTSTGTVAVTVDVIPAAVPGGNVTICSGSSAQLGAAPVAGLAYSWSPATGLSNPASANTTVTLTNTTSAATTTTYTLTVTNPATSCTSTGTVAVTVNPNPVITPGANVVICSGETGQLGAAPVAGLTYQWSPATGLSSATAANPTVTLTNTNVAPVTQTYTLTVTNPATGCVSTGTVDVLVNPTPVPMPGPDITICSGSPSQLGAAPLPGYTYVWTPATGLSNPNIANPTVTLTNTTGAATSITYTLRLTSAPITCTNQGTVTVTVNPAPAVAPGAAVAICSGNTAQLGAPPVAGYAYSWSPATGLSSATSANPTVTLTNTTSAPVTATYTLTVTNSATSCTNTGTVDVLVNPNPVPVPGATASICSGGTAQLGAAPVAGYTYSWTPATGLSNASIANPTVTLTNTTSAPVTQTYTLTVTNTATTCVNTGTVDVVVYPNPVPMPGANIATCSGVAGQLGDAPLPGYTYQWSPATGLNSATVANPTVTLTNNTGAATTQTYTLTVTVTATGCTSTGTVVVTVNPLPAVAPGATITFCSGNSGSIGAPPVAGFTYSWSPTTGLSNPTSANPTVTLTNLTGAAITQTYTLTVTSTATTCSNTGTVAVRVNPAIRPGTIGTDQNVCPLYASSPLTELAPASAGVGTYSYQWESSPDGVTWTAIPAATGTTYAPGLLSATMYYRRRASSGDCAVAYSNVVKLTIQPVLATGVTLPTPAAQCAGTPITFVPVLTNAGPSPTYRWFVNGVLTAVTTPTYTSSGFADGDLVTVEVTTSANFCATGTPRATAPARLTPIPVPTVAIGARSPLPGCLGEPISFGIDNTTFAGATPAYQWLIDGQPVAGATAPTFTTTALRDGQVVSLLFTAAGPCGPLPVTSAGIKVGVNPAVDVEAGPDQTIMEGDQVRLLGTANGKYPVTWSPAATLSSATVLQPVASPTVTTTYTLSARVVNCSDQSSVTVTVTPRPRIPSAFSPNGDGRDDTWQIDDIDIYAGNHVTVFNRWGAKLFETQNYGPGNEWNGTVKGQPAPVGTYYFVITAKGHSFTGPLTIIY